MAKRVAGTEKTKIKREQDNYYNDYICFLNDSIDFSWKKEDVLRVKALWNMGYSIENISIDIERPIDEIALLIIDQARKNKIAARKGGIFGSREDE